MEPSANPDAFKSQPSAPAPEPSIHPMLESAGKFADDPFWDETLDSIRRHRLEMDAAWDTEE